MLPRLIVNFKSYKRATGRSAIRLTRRIAMHNVAVCPQWVDLPLVSSICFAFAQSVDPVFEGPYTGHNTVYAASLYAKGVLLNHSEKPIRYVDLVKAVELCKQHNLKTVVCVHNLREAKKVDKLEPDIIAFEPPSLIGTGKSVSKHKSHIIRKIVAEVSSDVYVGAGITARSDVKRAVDLGATGVLVSSAVVKSSNPEKKVMELLDGFRRKV